MSRTPGPWRIGSMYGAIVADAQYADPKREDADSIAAYGGALVAESVEVRNRRFIAAAPTMLTALVQIRAVVETARSRVTGHVADPRDVYERVFELARAAIDAAEGES